MMQPNPNPQMQSYTPVTQPIIIQTSAPVRGSKKYEGLLSKPIIVLGGMQIGIGLLCILFNSIGLGIHAYLAEVAQGIWCGILFIITGGFGMFCGFSKTLCPIITFMVLSIISAPMTVPLLVISAIGLGGEYHNDYYYNYNYHNYNYPYEYGSLYSDDKLAARKAMNGLLIFLAVVEALVAIVSASLCCHGICCCRQGTRGAVYGQGNQQVQYLTSTNTGQGQIIVIQGGGQMPVGQIQPVQSPAYPVQGTPIMQQPQYTNPTPAPSMAPAPGPPAYGSDPPPEYNPDFVKSQI